MTEAAEPNPNNEQTHPQSQPALPRSWRARLGLGVLWVAATAIGPVLGVAIGLALQEKAKALPEGRSDATALLAPLLMTVAGVVVGQWLVLCRVARGCASAWGVIRGVLLGLVVFLVAASGFAIVAVRTLPTDGPVVPMSECRCVFSPPAARLVLGAKEPTLCAPMRAWTLAQIAAIVVPAGAASGAAAGLLQRKRLRHWAGRTPGWVPVAALGGVLSFALVSLPLIYSTGGVTYEFMDIGSAECGFQLPVWRLGINAVVGPICGLLGGLTGIPLLSLLRRERTTQVGPERAQGV